MQLRGEVTIALMLVTRRAASDGRACSQQVGDLLERVEQHACGRRARVEHANPLGLGRGQLVVGARDRSEEARLLALQPVGQLAANGLARAGRLR